MRHNCWRCMSNVAAQSACCWRLMQRWCQCRAGVAGSGTQGSRGVCHCLGWQPGGPCSASEHI